MKGNPTLVLKNIFATQFSIIIHTTSKFYINEGTFKLQKKILNTLLIE